MMQNEKIHCKKLIYQDELRQSHIVLGIFLSEDESFIRFKTKRREILISKKYIVSISDTDQIFEEEDDAQ